MLSPGCARQPLLHGVILRHREPQPACTGLLAGSSLSSPSQSLVQLPRTIWCVPSARKRGAGRAQVVPRLHKELWQCWEPRAWFNQE